MRLQDMGNCVKIGTALVPAVNIQVEFIPEGYGIYFEILFENGDLWVVNKESDTGDIITEVFADWAHQPDESPLYIAVTETWELFLENYKENK